MVELLDYWIGLLGLLGLIDWFAGLLVSGMSSSCKSAVIFAENGLG
ncbi:hypothetical protein [Paenibacillus mesotrionivorans]|uniref:Uncharacterized protein n=1 Tax=Paenibacillus mesotrionivorans TaxID=3160968 RepID=A0ACC7NWV8_9BACL